MNKAELTKTTLAQLLLSSSSVQYTFPVETALFVVCNTTQFATYKDDGYIDKRILVNKKTGELIDKKYLSNWSAKINDLNMSLNELNQHDLLDVQYEPVCPDFSSQGCFDITMTTPNRCGFLKDNSIFIASTHYGDGKFFVYIHPDGAGFTIDSDYEEFSHYNPDLVHIEWLDTPIEFSRDDFQLVIIDPYFNDVKSGVRLDSPYYKFHVGLVWSDNKLDSRHHDRVVFRAAR